MPLVVNCNCGKKLQVGDNLAGKIFRCPACQTVLQAPQLDNQDTQLIVAAIVAPPAGPKSKTVAIPIPQSFPKQSKVMAAIAMPVSASQEDGEEESAPKKKKKKKAKQVVASGPNWGLLGGIGGGILVLLLVGGFFVMKMLQPEADVDEWAMFTQEPAVFATVDVTKMAGTPQGTLIQALMAGSPAVSGNPFFTAAEIGLSDIKRLSITLANPQDPTSFLVAISSNKKMNRAKLEADAGGKAESINGRKVWTKAGDQSSAYLAPGDKVMVWGSKQALTPFTLVKGGTPAPTLPAIVQKGRDSSKQLYAWFRNPDPNAKAPDAASAIFMTMTRFASGVATFELGDTCNLSLELDYGEKAKASAALTTFKTLPFLLGTMAATMGGKDPQQKATMDAVMKQFREIKPEQNEGMVKLNLTLSGNDFLQGVRAGLPMMQAMMPAGPGPGRGGPPNMGLPGPGSPPTYPGAQSTPGGGFSFPAGAIGAGPFSSNTPPPTPQPRAPVTGSSLINQGPGAAVMATRGAGDRAFNKNQLKSLAMALSLYATTNNNQLPPATICDGGGKPLLSWRVAILPAIDQDNLFRQFNMSEPWDGPNNIKLLPLMPKSLSPRNQSGESLTPYRVFAGNGAVFEPRSHSSLSSIGDGTSNTFMVVETFEMVEWTKPEWLDINQPPPMGSGGKGQFSVAMVDGSTRSFSSDMPKNDLRAWITKSGGEITPNP